MTRALAAALLTGALLLAACGVKSDPSWPGGVWGVEPPSPGGASAVEARPAPAGSPPN